MYDECSESNFVLLEVNYQIATVFRKEALLREVEKEWCHASGNVELCKEERAWISQVVCTNQCGKSISCHKLELSSCFHRSLSPRSSSEE